MNARTLLLILVEVQFCCYVDDALDTITVVSPIKPFESRIVLRKKDLRNAFDHWSPPFQAPSGSEVEWRFKFRAPHQHIDLELHHLPRHISYAMVSVNCTLKGNANVTYVSTPTTVGEFMRPKTLINLASYGYYHEAESVEVVLNCHLEGLLGENVITVENNSRTNAPETDKVKRTSDCWGSNNSHSTEINCNGNGKDKKLKMIAEGKTFECHTDILSKRAPLLLPTGHRDEYDLGYEMNGLELEDLVHFLNYGNASHADRTCPKLYLIAKKYDIDCLDHFCEHELFSQIDLKTADGVYMYAVENQVERLGVKALFCMNNRRHSKCAPTRSYDWW